METIIATTIFLAAYAAYQKAMLEFMGWVEDTDPDFKEAMHD